MDELVFRFLIQSHITSFTEEDVYLQLLSHIDYSSLKAITGTRDYFGIESLAANAPKDALSQLPKSFLALVEKQGSTELVLVTQSKKKVHGIDNRILQTHRDLASQNDSIYTPETLIGN